MVWGDESPGRHAQLVGSKPRDLGTHVAKKFDNSKSSQQPLPTVRDEDLIWSDNFFCREQVQYFQDSIVFESGIDVERLSTRIRLEKDTSEE